MPRIFATLTILLCLLAAATSSFAQTVTTASLKGRIFDEGGDGLPGVVVTLTNPGAAVGAQSAVTDLEGGYAFRLLPPGDGYTLRASVPGYATIVAGPFDLDPGRTTVQNLTLKPSKDIQETVQVEARGEIVDTSSTKTSTTYGSEFIEGLPLLGRKFNDILTLAPGVTDPDGDGNPNVRGARDTGLQLRLDGTNLTDPLTGHFAQDINLETIEEIEIITSGASAEYGRADGGFANIITKSGGNDTEGAVKIFFRSKFFDSDGAGNNDAEVGVPVVIPDFSDTRAFFTLGGAFVKDHFWYFTSIEWLDREEPVVFTTGDAALKTLVGWNTFAKITWQLDLDDKLALQLNYDPLERGGNFLGSRTPPDSDYLIRNGGPLLQVKWTSIISPRLLLETLVSHLDGGVTIDPVSSDFRKIEVRQQAGPLGKLHAELPCRTTNCGQDRSIFTYRNQTGGLRGATTTSIRGPYFFAEEDQRERSTFKADLSYTIDEALGSHSIKTGFEFNDERYSSDPIHNPIFTDSTVDWSQLSVPVPPTPPSIRYGTLLMDIFEPVQPELSSNGLNTGAFLQDSWKPLPNLTINAGVRFDLEEIDSRGFSPFDPGPESREILRRFNILCDVPGPCAATRAPGRIDKGLSDRLSLDGVPPEHPAHGFDLNGDGLVDLSGSSPEFANYIAPFTRYSERQTEGFAISNWNLSPRFSLSWDPWADGRTKLFGTWNVYYDRIFLGVATAEQQPSRFTARWEVFGPRNQADPNSRSQALGPVSVNQIDRDLATPHTIEWSAGVERELAPEWAVSLTYVRRRGMDLLQDMDVNHISCNLFDRTFNVKPYDVCGDGGTLELDRFGKTVGTVRLPNDAVDLYVLNPFWNQVLRTGNFNSSQYTSAELALRKRLHRSWQMQLSYTWSIATGQAEQFIDLAGNDPAVSDSVFGYLDYDQRHLLKWQAVTHLPHGLVLGSTIQWASGLPYSFVHTTPDEDDQGNLTGHRLSFPSGEKNDRRNGGQWTINARIERSFILRKAQASAFLSGENLLDSDDLTIVAYRTGSRGTGLEGGKRFGRRWEMGLAFEF